MGYDVAGPGPGAADTAAAPPLPATGPAADADSAPAPERPAATGTAANADRPPAPDRAAAPHRTPAAPPDSPARHPSPAPLRVVALVVAYNRADLLRHCLDALAAQTRAVDAILVINNASTDDSAAVASRHPARPTVRTLPRNTGGAGGFAAGVAIALAELAADALWLMDDDTIPTPTALAELLRAATDYPGRVDVAGSRVIWTDGRDHPMNTPRAKPGASRQERARAAAVGAIPIRSTSFVSMLISADAIRAGGLPVADYFIWNDDFEYSTRLLRRGIGLHVRGSVVEHWTKTFGATDADPGDRFFYEVRNKIWMLTRSRSLGPAEKLLYGAATLRRWARTIARSADRPRLARAAFRGLAAGAHRPVSTAMILRSLGMTPPATQPVADPRGLADPLGSAVPATAGSATAGAAIAGPGAAIPGAANPNAANPDGAADPGAAPPNATSPAPLPFSLLLPVYAGDRPEFLRRAYDSATAEQTRPPDEVVIVRDGPVGAPLAAELAAIADRAVVPTTILPLPRNIGLARALTAGLERCAHEVVARADADDICLPERFATQLPVIEAGADLVGSAIVEFGDDENVTGAVRAMPTDPAAIAARARIADPFNHPSVVYRKSAVARAGGYEHLHLMEDYLLFARMIAHGATVANVPEVLVKYRTGAGSYARRGGRQLLRAEIALQRTFRAEGFISGGQFARNLVIRGGYRLVPQSLRRIAYRALVLRRG